MTQDPADATAVAFGKDVYYARTYWNDFDEVVEAIHRRMDGGPWWRRVRDALGGTPARCALILNSGDGHVERELIAEGVCERAIGVDYAQDLLDEASAAAREGSLDIEYHRMDTNTADFPVPDGGYDLVINHAAAHHLTHVDRVFRRIHELLAPNGWFAHFDYTGPHRNQYSPEMWQAAHEVNLQLPTRLRQSMRYELLAEIMARDPSEAVGAERVLPCLHRYFDCVEESPLGGSIGYLLLTGNFAMFDAAPTDRRRWLEMVIEADEAYLQAHPDDSLFTYALARPKPGALDDSEQLRRWSEEERRLVERASTSGGIFYAPNSLQVLRERERAAVVRGEQEADHWRAQASGWQHETDRWHAESDLWRARAEALAEEMDRPPYKWLSRGWQSLRGGRLAARVRRHPRAHRAWIRVRARLLR